MQRIPIESLLTTAWLVAQSALAQGGGLPPPWREEARLFGQIHENFWDFGHAVDLDGDVAIVGAPMATIEGVMNRGAAYVFRRSGSQWTEEAMLFASDGGDQDFFGWAVAIEGSRVLVSAPFHSTPIDLFRGAVYVFERVADQWIEVQKITSSDGDEQDHFGYSLDVEGCTLVVGAQRAGPGTQVGGAAYVFAHDGVTWVEQQKLFDPQSGPGDTFGNSVALDGATIAVADHSHASTAGNNAGAVYVFTRLGVTWVQEQMLEASDAGPIDLFGSDLALHGDRIVAGARMKRIGANSHQGAAYVFTRAAGVWTEQQRLTAANGHEDSDFGRAVAMKDRLLLVGAELDIGMQNNRGVVYEFRLEDGVWEEVQWFVAPIGQGLDSFGEAIELDRGRLIVGNPDNVAVSPSGTAWIFLRPLLFADGFESGDTAAWSGAVP